MIPARRTASMVAFLCGLAIVLAAAPACCKRWCGTKGAAARADNSASAGNAGVTVTAPVPHAGTTGAAQDNAGIPPSAPVVPRAIPIGKKPPPDIIPPASVPW